MKKVIIVSSLLLCACGTSNHLVQQSDYIITTKNQKVVYIIDNNIGRMLHRTWITGAYGEAEVHLIDEKDFNNMSLVSTNASR
jgi:hypothetical protein